MKLWVDYTNHKGQRNPERPVYPMAIRFGSSQWHQKPQWLMQGVDMAKAEKREFAMADMHDVRPTPTFLVFTLDSIRSIVTRLEEIARMAKTKVTDAPLMGQQMRAIQLADECLKEFSRNKIDDPIEFEPPHRLYIEDTDAIPDEMHEVLGLHPGMAIRFASMARNAGYVIPLKAEAELAFVHWFALRCYLKHGKDKWKEAMEVKFVELRDKARERMETQLARQAREEQEKLAAGTLKPPPPIPLKPSAVIPPVAFGGSGMDSPDRVALVGRDGQPIPAPACTCDFAIDSCPVHGLGPEGREDKGG